MLHFFKKIKKITCRYHYQNLDDMIYSSWDIEQNILTLHNRHNFLSFWTASFPFTPYGPRKSKFWKNEKSNWRYYHFTNVYHKWQSYDVWFLRYGVQQTEFFVILDHFLPFYPSNNPKNQNFEKMKKLPGDIIILHRCNINDNHMMYGSWDTEHDRLPFYPLTTQKIIILKKWKKHLEILSFYTCAP